MMRPPIPSAPMWAQIMRGAGTPQKVIVQSTPVRFLQEMPEAQKTGYLMEFVDQKLGTLAMFFEYGTRKDLSFEVEFNMNPSTLQVLRPLIQPWMTFLMALAGSISMVIGLVAMPMQ